MTVQRGDPSHEEPCDSKCIPRTLFFKHYLIVETSYNTASASIHEDRVKSIKI